MQNRPSRVKQRSVSLILGFDNSQEDKSCPKTVGRGQARRMLTHFFHPSVADFRIAVTVNLSRCGLLPEVDVDFALV